MFPKFISFILTRHTTALPLRFVTLKTWHLHLSFQSEYDWAVYWSAFIVVELKEAIAKFSEEGRGRSSNQGRAVVVH